MIQGKPIHDFFLTCHMDWFKMWSKKKKKPSQKSTRTFSGTVAEVALSFHWHHLTGRTKAETFGVLPAIA